ncbi:hypothetical protein [uncultured Desulfobacter sp.]|uniref:hypothetical protein n=1 Tax=uncultured Desulfobacter sp. TaxID=240139 RepID=UPI00374A8F96
MITAGSVQYGDYLWDLPQTQTTPGSTTRYGYDLNGRILSVTAQNSAQATLLTGSTHTRPEVTLTPWIPSTAPMPIPMMNCQG